MIVLILVAILWIAVLVPSVIAKLRERRSAGSIGRFHQRLDLLERTGPKLVEPAYRLTGTDSTLSSRDPLVVAAPPPPVRPNLTLVPPVEDVDADAEWAEQPLSEGVAMRLHEARANETELEPDRREPEAPRPERRDTPAMRRRRAARRRRRDVFAALCALTALTGLLGLVPALRGAWIVSGISVGLLVGFVGLAVYGQRIDAERRHLVDLHRSEQTRTEHDHAESSIVKYLSEGELALYHEALSDYYAIEDTRLAAQG